MGNYWAFTWTSFSGVCVTLSSLSFWSGFFHPWIWTCPLMQIGVSVLKNCKQCRSWWDGSIWALSCGSTLLAQVTALVCRAERVIELSKSDNWIVENHHQAPTKIGHEMRHGETFLTQILRYPFGKRSVLKGNNLLPSREEPFSVGICVQASKREVTKVKMMEVFQVLQSLSMELWHWESFLTFLFSKSWLRPLILCISFWTPFFVYFF